MRKLFLFLMLNVFVFRVFSQATDSIKKVDIDEVVITTTRSKTKFRNIPQKVELINQAAISSIPSDNAAEVLKRTTNLDIIQYPGMSAKIGMRGFSPSAHSRSYTLILINGVPTATTNLASINTDNIESIEVIKGPYSALYGTDAMGGVINIITKTAPTETLGRVSLGLGSFGTIKFSGEVGGVLSDKTNFQFGYMRNEQRDNYRIGSNSFFDIGKKGKAMLDSKSFGDVMENSSYQVNELNANLGHRINDRWNVSASVIYAIAHDVNTPGNYWGSYGQSKKDIDRINLTLPVRRVSETNTFSVSPYFSEEETQDYNNNSDTAFVSLRSRDREYGFKLSDNFDFGVLKMLAGSDLDVSDYDSKRYKDASTVTVPYQPNSRIVKAAVFAQATYEVGGLLVNAGGRFDQFFFSIDANDLLHSKSSNNRYSAFNPSLGVQYTFPFSVKLHGSFGTAFSVPDAFRVAGSYSRSTVNYKGNRDLKPESSLTVDFGVGFTSTNKAFTMDVTVFNTNHTDRIVYDYSIPDTITFKNASSALYRGIETMASVNVGKFMSDKFKLELYANFTFIANSTFEDTKVDASGNTVKFDRDMLYVRKANGSFGLTFDSYKGFSTRLNARYIGSRLEKDYLSSLRPTITADDYYDKGGYAATDKVLLHPNYLVFDYSIFYTVQQNKRFGITISNLLDENYTEKDGYNMPGRSLMGSFTYNF